MKQTKKTNIQPKLFIFGLYTFGIVLLFAFYNFLGKSSNLDDSYKFSDKLQSVSYAPFKYDESPMDLEKGFVIPDERIDKDLELLAKHFKSIRIYSVNGLESVPKYARKHGLKLLLGVWVCSDEEVTQKELQTMLKLVKEYPDVISAVVVGNEVLLRREMSGERLASYIKWVKENVTNIPVTYADVWEFWLKNQNLAPLVDFVTIHILPYWEDNPVSIDTALEHIKATHLEVSSILKDKEILIGETGWPSEGRMRGASLPSPITQAEFFRGFLKIADENSWNYNIIEAFDQPWKRSSEGAVGGYWGIYDKNSMDKNTIWGEVSEFGNINKLFFFSVVIFLSSLIFLLRTNNNSFINIGAIVFALIGSALLIFQINQYFITSKDIVDYIRSFIFTILSFILYFGVIDSFTKVIQSKNILRLFEISRLGVIFVLVVGSISLFLDGRYRSFENYGLLLSVLSLGILYFHKTITQIDLKNFEKLSFMTLTICGIGIIYIEGFENIQAIVWAVLSFVLAGILYLDTKNSSLKIFYPYIAVVLISGLIIYIIRATIFVNSDYVLICENNPDSLVCGIRALLGYLVYNQYLGFISAVLGLIFVWFRKKVLAYMSLIFALVAILFFNANIGVIVFVLSLLIIDLMDKNKKVTV